MNPLLNQETEKYFRFPSISEQIGAEPKFGRLILNDERSLNHPMRAMNDRTIKQSVKRKLFRNWQPRWQGDQGSSSMCTAFSLLHLWEHDPVNHPRSRGKYKGMPRPIRDPRFLYCEAQKIDPWPGGCGSSPVQDAYDGSSILAMMHVAREHKLIKAWATEYRNIDNIVEAILHRGPVLMGTNWYKRMMLAANDPNTKEAQLLMEGPIIGGHAYILDGVDLRKQRTGREIQVFNSWGNKWGWSGRAFMSLDMLEKLLWEDGGEAYIVEEEE